MLPGTPGYNEDYIAARFYSPHALADDNYPKDYVRKLCIIKSNACLTHANTR